MSKLHAGEEVLRLRRERAETIEELTKTELDPINDETLPQLAARVVAELRAQMQWGSELFRACEAVVGPQPAGPGGEDEVVTRLRAIPVALQELLDYATERQAAQAAVPPSARSPEGATAAELIGRIRNRVEGLSALLDGADEDSRQELEQARADVDQALRDVHDLSNILARHELSDVPLPEIAAARAEEGNLHRELLKRLSPGRLGLLCDWLAQSGDELGQSTVAELLHELAQPVQDESS